MFFGDYKKIAVLNLLSKKSLSLTGKLLPGMLPLLLFVAVELFWGTTAGLVSALVLGFVQVLWFWLREKQFDKFVLLDIAFLTVLGGLAIIFDNAILFKLKPVFIGVAVLLLIGYLAFSDPRLIMMMGRRYFKGYIGGPFDSWLMQEMLKVFFWVFLVHTFLVLVAALLLPHAWWAAISGPGFYFLVVLMTGIIWLINKRRHKTWNNEEWLPLVDESGKNLGHAPRSLVHSAKTN